MGLSLEDLLSKCDQKNGCYLCSANELFSWNYLAKKEKSGLLPGEFLYRSFDEQINFMSTDVKQKVYLSDKRFVYASLNNKKFVNKAVYSEVEKVFGLSINFKNERHRKSGYNQNPIFFDPKDKRQFDFYSRYLEERLNMMRDRIYRNYNLKVQFYKMEYFKISFYAENKKGERLFYISGDSLFVQDNSKVFEIWNKKWIELKKEILHYLGNEEIKND